MFGISFSMRRPANLGVKDGRLAPCKRSPNCVSSQADPVDKEHYIAPISFSGTMEELRKVIAGLELATIVEAKDDYLYAEFRTPFLRFIDDVELYYEKNSSLIQVRSASRLGRRDFKANRRRVEQLRAFIQARR
ncbi:MAG: hypothetical protein K0R40_4161 [Burkholderiales bacterium]|nr:hypothetical protein [Burkholderiales bacterium]